MSLTSPHFPTLRARRLKGLDEFGRAAAFPRPAFPRHRRRRPLHHYVFGVWALALAGLWLLGRMAGGPADFALTETPPAPFTVARVVDGDTFVLGDGERVRISNIDTAEMAPRAECPAEAALALAGKARLAELLPPGARIDLVSVDRDRDVYGRLLREVRVDGRDVGDRLVAEGLAQPWRGHTADWC